MMTYRICALHLPKRRTDAVGYACWAVPCLVAATLVLALGCGGSSSGKQASEGGSLRAVQEAWCPILAKQFCAAAETCGCSDVPGFVDSPCVERTERGCRKQLDAFAARVASGELTVASSLPAGCMPALERSLATCRMPEADVFTVSCPLVWPKGASRELPVAAKACAEGLCAEGTRCSATNECAMPKAGSKCAAPGDCLPSERCGAEGLCGVPRFEGVGTACLNPTECSGDSLCLAAARRECRPKVVGAECTGDEACIADEYCDNGGCTPSPGLDAPCGAGVACAADLACRIAPGPKEGTCQPLPTSDEFCALGRLGPFQCEAGLACSNRRCGPVPVEGEPCAGGELRCADGLGCHVEAAQSVCRVRVSEGKACGLDDSCATGLYCDFGESRCARFLTPGEVCTDGNECGTEGACVPGDAGVFRCVTRPIANEACFLDDTCAGGLFCRSSYDAGVCAPPMCAAFQF